MVIILVKYIFNTFLDSEKNADIGKTNINSNPILYPSNNYHFRYNQMEIN